MMIKCKPEIAFFDFLRSSQCSLKGFSGARMVHLHLNYRFSSQGVTYCCHTSNKNVVKFLRITNHFPQNIEENT